VRDQLKVLALRVGAPWFAMKRALTQDCFRVVTYHGVDPLHHPVLNFDRLQADPAVFSRQIDTLSRHFHIIDLQQAVRQFLAEGCWPRASLAITFDDGYRNNLDIAAPILKQKGVPATFFVTSGYCEGRTSPWWYRLRQHLDARPDLAESQKIQQAVRLEAELRPLSARERDERLVAMGCHQSENIKSPYPFMTPDECRKLLAMGFDVQCHGDTHASFGGEAVERVVDEVRASAKFIKLLGHTPWALAYPYGREPRDPGRIREELAASGIIAAFTTLPRHNNDRSPAYAISRFDMHGGYSPAAMMARLSS